MIEQDTTIPGHSSAEVEHNGTEARGGGTDQARSRRQLLTLAGAAAVGGTALVLGQSSPAGAANGDPIRAGEITTASIDTILQSSGGANAVFHAEATEAGVNGIRAQGNGNALDIKLTGTGRLGQRPATTGNGQPGFNIKDFSFGSPVVQGHEIVRSDTGVIWASTGTGVAANTRWKRINSLRVDNPNGNGAAFAPFRLVDTRDGSGAIGTTGPRTFNTTTTFNAAARPQIPDDAVALFGNITVVSPSHGGFVTLWPTGVPKPTVAAINFRSTDPFVNNAFIVGLSTGGNAGRFSLQPGSAAGGSVHVVIDINGYVQ